MLSARAPAPGIDRQPGPPLTPPHRIIDTLSKSVSDGVLDGLELNPGHRPQTVDAFLARLGCGMTAHPRDDAGASPPPPLDLRHDVTRAEGTRPLPSPPAP